ncbi:Asp-tRNA(Asn)/Glu-tRNA(Gln) amidotransferase subunit GatB [Candidatus Sumerlaeota bacterium]|nr:Asp-tRNA(Asn)/Glu-tRNA(Gln) amidotransferase subunit GatB [Candidatus Sumerlaeota bacterium]
MDLEPVIGIEIHTELSTKSKIFCGCSTKFGSSPNTQTCPVCLGMPGSLPVLNKTALEYTIRTALALHCEITEHTTFDRKNYYYPDLPKNYQISQNYACLGYNGWIEISSGKGVKRIGIHNVHLEEDAGKNIHPESGDSKEYSLVDLNRAGMPLIEIVSAPDMNGANDAMAYMTIMKNLLQYLEASDCRMQEGHLRFEVNISLKPKDSRRLGTRVEIKNLNSMKVALKSIEYEIERQKEVLESGGEVDQETRLWDEAAGITRTMRTKEFAQDYRYFPEPDLVEIHITPEWREEIRKHLPELQGQKRNRFISQYGLPEYDASILTGNKLLADYYEECVRIHSNPKTASNWIMTELLRELNQKEWEPDTCPVTSAHMGNLIKLMDEGVISGKIGKQVFSEMLDTGKMPGEIIRDKGLAQITSEDEISGIVEAVMKENEGTVEAIRGGRNKAMGFLVGEIMKKSRGKANPKLVNEILKKKIGV